MAKLIRKRHQQSQAAAEAAARVEAEAEADLREDQKAVAREEAAVEAAPKDAMSLSQSREKFLVSSALALKLRKEISRMSFRDSETSTKWNLLLTREQDDPAASVSFTTPIWRML